jgi:hypothetical protein
LSALQTSEWRQRVGLHAGSLRVVAVAFGVVGVERALGGMLVAQHD